MEILYTSSPKLLMSHSHSVSAYTEQEQVLLHVSCMYNSKVISLTLSQVRIPKVERCRH